MKGAKPLEFHYRREFSRAGEVVYRPVARFSVRSRSGEFRSANCWDTPCGAEGLSASVGSGAERFRFTLEEKDA